jgi:hypothetical protein
MGVAFGGYQLARCRQNLLAALDTALLLRGTGLVKRRWAHQWIPVNVKQIHILAQKNTANKINLKVIQVLSAILLNR